MPKSKTFRTRNTIPYRATPNNYKSLNSIKDSELATKISFSELKALEEYVKSGDETKLVNVSKHTIFVTAILFFFGHGIGSSWDWFHRWYKSGFLKRCGGYFGCAYLRKNLVNSFVDFAERLKRSQTWLSLPSNTLELSRAQFATILEVELDGGSNDVIDPIPRIPHRVGESVENVCRRSEEESIVRNMLQLIYIFKRKYPRTSNIGQYWRACIKGCPCNNFQFYEVFERVGEIITNVEDYGESDDIVYISDDEDGTGEIPIEEGDEDIPPEDSSYESIEEVSSTGPTTESTTEPTTEPSTEQPPSGTEGGTPPTTTS